ncbi:MAG: TlpA disulfide reductase family protein [Bacteroidia bacterium]|nr:TlpA disulfide reductase family protein [Bacteroidia bacterium]
MRLAKKLSIFALALSAVACQKKQLSVDAQLTNVDDGFVYLSTIDTDMKWHNIDTAKVENGHFTFNTENVHEGGECFMILTPNQQQVIFFANTDKVIINGDIDMASSIAVEGAKLHTIYEKFVNNVPEQDHLKKLNRELANAQYNVDKTNALKEEIYNAQMEQLAYIKRFVTNNVGNAIGSFVLINSVNYFSYEETDQFSKQIAEKQPNHKYTKIIESIVENRRTIYEAMQRVEIGQKAPDFSLEGADGNQYKLSDTRGKNVIMSFWISNDRLSRMNNVALSEVEKKFNNKNLIVLGISVDQDKERWLKAVAEDKAPGIQLIDIDNSIAATYCVPRLPYCILLDAEGKIVAKDYNAESVFSDVESLLK